MRLVKMVNNAVKKIVSEKRTLSLGQLIEDLCSGRLRDECNLDKEHFAQLIGTTRKTIRDWEGLERVPQISMILSAATALGIKLKMPRPHHDGR